MAASKPHVLFDLNIILDVMQNRAEFFEYSARLLAYAETGRIQGWIAAHSITTLSYLLEKSQNAATSRVVISALLGFLNVAPVDQAVIQQALVLPYRDFEDAVQMSAAQNSKIEIIVTRNPQDYRPAQVTVLLPAELLAVL